MQSLKTVLVASSALLFSLSLVGCGNIATATFVPDEKTAAESNPEEKQAKPKEHPWAVAKGKLDGKPVFERFRADIKEPDPNYPYQATFIMPFKNPDSLGLFAPAEEADLDSFEDYLFKEIEESGKGVMVSVHTLGGARHFVFYTKEDIREKAEQVVKHAPQGYKIGGEIARDPEWTLFMGTLKRLSNQKD